jgi:hypothetical protein
LRERKILMLLFEIFGAIVRLVITANLALVLFLLNIILKAVTLPVFLLGRRAYGNVDFFIFTKSLNLLSFVFYGPNRMK